MSQERKAHVRNLPAAAQFADRFNGTDEVSDAARSIAADYSCRPLDTTAANLLEVLTRLASPASAIEVGTGTGVSSLALLRGMAPSGVLTSIDTGAQRQSVTEELIKLAGIPQHRVRMITGAAESVLGRLAADSYHLVFIDADPYAYPTIIPLAFERLAAGGLLIVHNVTDDGNVANPAVRGASTQAARRALKIVEELPVSSRVLLPIDSGFLAAVR